MTPDAEQGLTLLRDQLIHEMQNLGYTLAEVQQVRALLQAIDQGRSPEPSEETTRIQLLRRITQLEQAIYWALGERGEFGEEPPPLAGKYRRPYWWRSELRERSGITTGSPQPPQKPPTAKE